MSEETPPQVDTNSVEEKKNNNQLDTEPSQGGDANSVKIKQEQIETTTVKNTATPPPAPSQEEKQAEKLVTANVTTNTAAVVATTSTEKSPPAIAAKSADKTNSTNTPAQKLTKSKNPVDPIQSDILFGKNEELHQNHIGTQNFQKLLGQFLDPFQDFKKRNEEFRVLESIYVSVTYRGGRFLEYDTWDRRYYELSKQNAQKWIQSGLEKAVPNANEQADEKKATGDEVQANESKPTDDPTPNAVGSRTTTTTTTATTTPTTAITPVANTITQSAMSPAFYNQALNLRAGLANQVGFMAGGRVPLPSSESSRNKEVPFPWKLHEMLEGTFHQKQDWIVSWMPHGRAFMVHKPDAFVDVVMPYYFNQTKFPSFQRQLNLYGFERFLHGPDKGAYYHKCFLRGQYDMCHSIRRVKNKGPPKRSSLSGYQPNFYQMPYMPALPMQPGSARAAIEAAVKNSSDGTGPRLPTQGLAVSAQMVSPAGNTQIVRTPPAALSNEARAAGANSAVQATPEQRIAGVKRAAPDSEPGTEESLQKIHDLRVQLNTLKEAGAAKDHEIRRLRRQLASNIDRVDKLRKDGDEKDIEIEKLTAELAAKDRKLEKLEQDRGKVIKGLFVKDSWADVDTFQENLYI